MVVLLSSGIAIDGPLSGATIEVTKAEKVVIGNWYVYYEGGDESAYRFDLGEEVSGIEMRLCIQTSPEGYLGYQDDGIRFTLVGKPVQVTTSQGSLVIEPIVGITRIGFRGDNEKSVGGLHVLYYVLPKRNYVNYINITVHAPFSKPRLDLARSYVKAWDPNVEVVHLVTWNLGWCAFNVTEDGRARTALASFGLPVGDRPMESALSFSFGKSFTPPKIIWRPNVYVEVGYAGGINIAPESFAGTGNYRCKINAGIGSGRTLNEAVSFGLGQTVYRVRRGDAPDLPVEEAASGSIDVMLEIGKKILNSPAAKSVLEALGYVLFVYDLAGIIASLGFDDTIANSKILVFKDVDVGDERFFAWFNFFAQIKSAGLSGGIVNFWGAFPFGSSVFDEYGASVTDLPDGGMQIGGILLDYYSPDFVREDIVTIQSDGYVSPVTKLVSSEDFVVYRLTCDAEATIIIERDNIILDGCGHTLKGGVVVKQTRATRRENVTVKSLKIEEGFNGLDLFGTGPFNIFERIYERRGIFLSDVFNVNVTGNVIADCQVGIIIRGAKFCTITMNNITGTNIGIYLGDGHYCYSDSNVISENHVFSSEVGIFTTGYGSSNITRNHVVGSAVGVITEGGRAQWAIETISHNEITRCEKGITCLDSGNKLVCGNTILNCTTGIDMWGSSESVLISKNRIAYCSYGVCSTGCTVSENEISDCGFGVLGGGIIEGNIISNCKCGIGYGYGRIVGNRIANAATGVYLTGEEILARQMPPEVLGNYVKYCRVGTLLQDLDDVVVRGNSYVDNDCGIYLTAFWWHAREISGNNFVRNNVSIFVEHDDYGDIIATVFRNNFIGNAHKPGGKPYWCFWDNGAEGNFWSDYSGEDADGDGIGDTPYDVGDQASDRYPLMEPRGELPPITTSYTVQKDVVIQLTSNSIISEFQYIPENRVISFYVEWRKGTKGFVDIKIPKDLGSGPLEVLFDGKPIPFNKSESADFIDVSFTYEHSRHEVVIHFKPEEAPFKLEYPYTVVVVGVTMLLLFGLVASIRKRRTDKRSRNLY